MGESERFSEFRLPRRRLTLGDDSNALVGLVTVHIIFFLVLMVIQVVYHFFQTEKGLFAQQVLPYFRLPANFVTLTERPWTLLTFMFSEMDVIRLLSNLIWLWTFGYILQELTGNKKLIPIYIYGGLAGATVFILSNYFITALRPNIDNFWLWGGGASTMALATATTFLAPDFRFFRNLNGGIPLWVLTLVYILVDFAGVYNLGPAYSLAHLGGAAAGILFIFLLRRGYDGSTWMNNFYHWITNVFSPSKGKAENNIRERVFYDASGRKPFKKTSNVTQQRVDEILDKINQKGYHFLTDEEKNILKRAADEDLN